MVDNDVILLVEGDFDHLEQLNEMTTSFESELIETRDQAIQTQDGSNGSFSIEGAIGPRRVEEHEAEVKAANTVCDNKKIRYQNTLFHLLAELRRKSKAREKKPQQHAQIVPQTDEVDSKVATNYHDARSIARKRVEEHEAVLQAVKAASGTKKTRMRHQNKLFAKYLKKELTKMEKHLKKMGGFF